MNNEYREWLISQIKTLTPDDAAQMSTYDIEKIYEAIGCLLPQSSHTTRANFLSAQANEYLELATIHLESDD